MIKIESISELHSLLGYEKPRHPLISVVDYNNINPKISAFNKAYILNLYAISLKNNSDCELKYGRQYYDFQEGSLISAAPNHVLINEADSNLKRSSSVNGWLLSIHPSLIIGSSLWDKMPQYSYFEYDVCEALHLSHLEKETIEYFVNNIKKEYCGNLDSSSNEIILSNLEVLLNYTKRFYNRQFITRVPLYKDAITEFEKLLKSRCTIEIIEKYGVPSVRELAQEMGYSPNYLSDILKKETGKTTQEYIKLRVLDLAKDLLLKTNEPIYQISEKLGFDQSSNFTRFIKSQSGVSPLEFRKRQRAK